MKIKYTPLIALCSLITACGSDDMNRTFNQPAVTLEVACEAHANFCEDYPPDSMCRNERRDFLEGHYYFRQQPNGKNAYSMLMLTRHYADCADRARLIEFVPADTKYPLPVDQMTAEQRQSKIEYKQRITRLKAGKESNYRHAMAFLSDTESRYKGYQTPHLLAYNWKYHLDKTARDTLIARYESGDLDDIDIEYLVIGTLARNDPARGINGLLDLLKKYPQDDYISKDDIDDDPTLKYAFDDLGVLHFDIFRRLTGIYFQQEDYERAFIFAMLLELNNDVTADTKMILDYMRKATFVSKNKLKTLEDITEDIHGALQDGAFSPSLLRKV